VVEVHTLEVQAHLVLELTELVAVDLAEQTVHQQVLAVQALSLLDILCK
jgi:hypothetical protein